MARLKSTKSTPKIIITHQKSQPTIPLQVAYQLNACPTVRTTAAAIPVLNATIRLLQMNQPTYSWDNLRRIETARLSLSEKANRTKALYLLVPKIQIRNSPFSTKIVSTIAKTWHRPLVLQISYSIKITCQYLSKNSPINQILSTG